MNPSLFSTQYALDSDHKYDRTYQNTSLSANGYLNRTEDSSNGGMGPSPSNGGLDFHAIASDPKFNAHPQMILGPPSSINAINSGNIAFSTYALAEQSRLSTANPSSNSQYPSGTNAFLSTTWNGSNLTDTVSSHRVPSIHGSVHDVFSPTLSLNGPYQPRNLSMDQYSYSLQHHSPINDAQYGYQRHGLNSPYHQPYSTTMTHMPSSNHGRIEGPPFDETKIIHQLTNAKGDQICPEILASIPKGFFQVENKWTCYRRNYFTVTCAFTLPRRTSGDTIYLARYSRLEPIQHYAVAISARTGAANNADSETRGLVQHTPKRDKATESVPGRHTVSPSEYSNLASTLYSAPQYHGGPSLSGSMFDSFSSPNHQTLPSSYSFERIQFQKATANNGKRRAQQQYYHVVVELQVNVRTAQGKSEWVTIATKTSGPMVVRGRSPGHYKDGRRDSQNNTDSDSNTNTLASFRHDGLGVSALRGDNSSSFGWMGPIQHGQSHEYGHPYSRAADESDESAFSTGSSTVNSSSPTDQSYPAHDISGMKTFSMDQAIGLSSCYAKNTNPDVIRRKGHGEATTENAEQYASFYSSQKYNSPTFEVTPPIQRLHG